MILVQLTAKLLVRPFCIMSTLMVIHEPNVDDCDRVHSLNRRSLHGHPNPGHCHSFCHGNPGQVIHPP